MNNAKNYILVSIVDQDKVVPICDQNKHLWDQIEDKDIVRILSDNSDITSYAISEESFETLACWYHHKVKTVHIYKLTRDNKDISSQVIRTSELTNEEVQL